MAFAFKKKESVRKAVKRLGQKRVEKALGYLEHCERFEAVHELRKEIKQLRALVRLVRAAISRSEYRRLTDTLRQAAGHLAAARDAQVKLSALAALNAHFKSQLSPRTFEGIKRILAAECRKEQVEMSRTQAPRKVGALLDQFAGRLASLKLASSGWAAISPGIRRSYRDGRREYRLARQTRKPEHFHEWRKRVKDLLYQAGLFCRTWPEQTNALETELEHLGDVLGNDHDLFVLAEPATMKQFRQEAPHEAETLKALVDERQRDLRAQALVLGAGFYQEKPSVFCQRLRKHWKRWRREQ